VVPPPGGSPVTSRARKALADTGFNCLRFVRIQQGTSWPDGWPGSHYRLSVPIWRWREVCKIFAAAVVRRTHWEVITGGPRDAVIGRWEGRGGDGRAGEGTAAPGEVLIHHVGNESLSLGGILIREATAARLLAEEEGSMLHRALQEVPPEGPLDDRGRHLLMFSPQGGGDGLIGDLGRIGRHEFLLHLDLQGIHLPRLPEHPLGEGEQDVHTVDAVPAHHGQVHIDEAYLVGLGDAEWLRQGIGKVGQGQILNELGGLRVELLPDLIEHVEVILAQGLCALFCGHTEVLQDDGNVHVDHDEEGDDDVGGEEEDAHCWAPTVPPGAIAVGQVGVTVGGSCVEDGAEEAIPASRRGDLEKAQHAVGKGLEVEHVVDASLPLDVGKVGHAEDGVDEHDEEEEEADVEEGGQGHHEGEEQRANPLGSSDQPEDAADPGQTDDTEERWGEEVLLDDVGEDSACGKQARLQPPLSFQAMFTKGKCVCKGQSPSRKTRSLGRSRTWPPLASMAQETKTYILLSVFSALLF
jgi:hypothetical protein